MIMTFQMTNMTDFKVKDCFICNFCRSICDGKCNEIKETLMSGKVAKNEQFYKDNADLATDRKQIIDCLGKYCDRPCKLQDKNAVPPIDVLVRTIKYLGNRCNMQLFDKMQQK